MFFSVDITVCSKNSLHAVSDSSNLSSALSKRGKWYTYQKILLSRPRGTQFGFLLANIFTPLPCIAFFMITLQCLAYLKKHIIAIKTIHLCLYQQKLQKPKFLFGFDTGVAIMVLSILIISKIIFWSCRAVYLRTLW